MQSELGRAVRRAFAVGLAARLPQFVQEKSGRHGVAQYVWRASEQLSFYLSLEVHRIWNSFTIEVAWSTSGKYPASTVPDDPNSIQSKTELRFRLGELWAPPPKDIWWEVRPGPSCTREEVRLKIEPPVQEALDQLVIYGVPYMQRVIERQSSRQN